MFFLDRRKRNKSESDSREMSEKKNAKFVLAIRWDEDKFVLAIRWDEDKKFVN